MAYFEDHQAKFDNLKVSLDLQNRDQLRRKANGGNSIIFAYPPEEEIQYLRKFEELNSSNEYHFIDIAKLLISYIDELGLEKFKRKYQIFKATPHKVFAGFLEFIVSDLVKIPSGKIPVLTRTGALYGTGIENVNIMEHKSIMGLNQPLVIMYPGKIDNENLYFLNFKPASKYRCTVID